MKKLIEKEINPNIELDGLTGKEIIAYRSLGGDSYCILHKLGSAYGFLPLNDPNSVCRYKAQNYFESVKLAQKSRQLFVFKSHDDLIENMYKKTF